MNVLVTGGAGYIGSHTAILLLEAGHNVIIVDNFSNSKPEAIKRIEELGKKEVTFYQMAVQDKKALQAVFEKENIDAVIHFAGLKAVGESVAMPVYYYSNNLTSNLVLLAVMKEFGVNNLVFSSSATVYGDPATVPITEDFPLSTTNPYGTTKLMGEMILQDAAKADGKFNPIILRYFNPVGAHQSGRIGEDPNGIPNNLMPYISQVAIGKLPKLSVFGGDYDTPDGTGVRDFIHVVDLAKGHVAALQLFQNPCGLQVFNLGTGKGYSVLDLVKAFEATTGESVPYQIVDRRPGDIAACYANPIKAEQELGWRAEYNIEDMCRDTWRWQSMNPTGYPES